MDDDGQIAAGLIARGAAAAVDGGLFVVCVIVLLFTSGSAGMPPVGWMTIFIFTFYYGYFLAEYGKSIGNALTATVVVGHDGSRLGYLGSGLRTAVFMAPLILVVTILHFDVPSFVSSALTALFAAYFAANIVGVLLPSRQTIYDAVTGTRVFFRPEIDKKSLPKALRNCLAILIGAVFITGFLVFVAFIVGLSHSKAHWC